MFLEYYKLREQPFGVTPDPRFLFMSETHRESLASLFYGLKTGRGFVALVAKPGMGKTSLLFRLMQDLEPGARTVFLFQTQCDTREFLRYLLTDMGIPSQGLDLVEMHSRLNEALVENARSGKQFVLIIDEAQNLDHSVLETVRLLSDFETTRSKLLQIILAGQPQLAEKLAHPSLVQLSQRVAILSRLKPFSAAETSDYIEHRLKVAGLESGKLFTPGAVEIIARHSLGIPRNINNLCFNALSWGYAEKQPVVDEAILRQVAEELAVNSMAAEAERFAAEVRAEDEQRQRAAVARLPAPAPLLAPTPPQAVIASPVAPPVASPVFLAPPALEPIAVKPAAPVPLPAVAKPISPRPVHAAGPLPAVAKVPADKRPLLPADQKRDAVVLPVSAAATSAADVPAPAEMRPAALPASLAESLPLAASFAKPLQDRRPIYWAAAAVVLLAVFAAGYGLRGKNGKPIVAPVTAASSPAAPAPKPASLPAEASSSSGAGVSQPVAAPAPVPAKAASESAALHPNKAARSSSSSGAAALAKADDRPDAPGMVTVVVKPQETLSQLSLQYLGQAEPKNFQQISDLNGLANPNHIEAGQRLILPLPHRTGNGTAANGDTTPAAAEQAPGSASQPVNRRTQP